MKDMKKYICTFRHIKTGEKGYRVLCDECRKTVDLTKYLLVSELSLARCGLTDEQCQCDFCNGDYLVEPKTIEIQRVEDLIVPRVHLNGTSKKELVDQTVKACAAAEKLLSALANMAPHGRDYYVIGGGVFPEAQKQHESRRDRVHSVLAELQVLMVEIDKQG